jgi:hydroxymethylglutaryl-CoA lyase/(R)-citramalyl-CoA lyase
MAGITVCDVGPRDGLQNEEAVLEPAVRAELVNRLAAAGVPRIEAVSFVSPDRVPQMAGAEEVAAGIERRDGTAYAGLVLNERGYERFAATALDRLHFTFAATEAFNERNVGLAVEDSLATLARIRDDRPVSVSISVSFGCPFEGAVDPGRVLDLAKRAVEAGAEEIVFADTIGVAVPRQVTALLTAAGARLPRTGAHFHNTRNTGFANAIAAIGAGAEVLDASVGGLGGCPFAPRATGNIATEDLVYLLHGEGIETGIDLDALIAVAQWLEDLLGRELAGQVYRAGPFAATLSGTRRQEWPNASGVGEPSSGRSATARGAARRSASS